MQGVTQNVNSHILATRDYRTIHRTIAWLSMRDKYLVWNTGNTTVVNNRDASSNQGVTTVVSTSIAAFAGEPHFHE